MATKQENERLAVVETKVEILNERIEKIDQKVEELPDKLTKALIKELDSRYARLEKVLSIESDVKDIKETVAPFSNARKKLWTVVVTSMVILQILSLFLYRLIKEKLGVQ